MILDIYIYIIHMIWYLVCYSVMICLLYIIQNMVVDISYAAWCTLHFMDHMQNNNFNIWCVCVMFGMQCITWYVMYIVYDIMISCMIYHPHMCIICIYRAIFDTWCIVWWVIYIYIHIVMHMCIYYMYNYIYVCVRITAYNIISWLI